MTCTECGADIEQPAGDTPAECLSCGRVYVAVEDIGWFGSSIIVYSAQNEEDED